MDRHTLNNTLNSAEVACVQSGVRFTQKRKNVLNTLLQAEKPLSAYEVAATYGELFGESIQIMSVYRMLDFLIQEDLVHKLSSLNKYITCSHILCDHEHNIPQFLICEQCEVVQEIGVKKNIIEALQQSVESAKFQLASPQL